MASFNLNITGGSSPYTISVKAQGDNTERFMSYSGGIVTFMYASGIHNYDIVVSKVGCTSATQSFTLNCDVPTPTPIPVPSCTPISSVVIGGTNSPEAGVPNNTYTISYTGSTLSSGTWSVSGGATITYQETSYCNITFPSAGSYTILYNYTSCGNSYSVNKTITATSCTVISGLNILGDVTLDANTDNTFLADYTGDSSTISSYLWSVSGSGNSIITANNMNYVTIHVGSNGGTVSLSVVSCGTTLSTSTNFTINSVPVPVPQPVPVPTGIIVPTCAVLFNNVDNLIYSYDFSTNTKTLLSTLINSADIAHTVNKLWLYNSTDLYEYDITLNPYTISLNSIKTLPFSVGAGLCAVDNNTLITSDFSTSPTKIIQLNLSTSITSTDLFNLPVGRNVAGDIIKTTDNKYILTTFNNLGSNYISQYNSSGVLEFDKQISPTISNPYGVFINAGEIYITNLNGEVYLFDKNTYSLSLVNTIIPSTTVAGASQVPSCCDTSITVLTPNLSIIQPNCSTSTTGKVTFTNVYNGYRWKACNSSTFVCSNDCSSYDGIISGNTFTFDSGYINGFGNQDFTIRIWSEDISCNVFKDYTVTFTESLC